MKHHAFMIVSRRWVHYEAFHARLYNIMTERYYPAMARDFRYYGRRAQRHWQCASGKTRARRLRHLYSLPPGADADPGPTQAVGGRLIWPSGNGNPPACAYYPCQAVASRYFNYTACGFEVGNQTQSAHWKTPA